MSKAIELHVDSVAAMGQRFIRAWQRLERGEPVDETHLTFFDLESMMSALSPRRLELLRQVHRHPAKTVAELAKTLGRDYKRVHDDVSTLTQVGLIVRDKTSIRAPYASILASVSLES